MKTSIYIFISILFLTGKLYSQDRAIQGIVFDRDSKQRLSRVYIYNTNTSKGFYNNGKGEFGTNASNGDVLVAALPGYRVDTVTVGSQNTVLFYLKRSSIQLKDVEITDSLRNPKDQLKETQEEFEKAYSVGKVGDVLTTGRSNSVAGAGLSINAIYSLLSKEGKNARQLQKIIERDYREAMITYRYNPSLINAVTGLRSTKLLDFMQQYRPAYNFVVEANDYQLITYIKSSYQKYLQNPAAYRLPTLKGNNE